LDQISLLGNASTLSSNSGKKIFTKRNFRFAENPNPHACGNTCLLVTIGENEQTLWISKLLDVWYQIFVKCFSNEWVMSNGLKRHHELNIKGFCGTDYSETVAISRL